MNLGIFLPMGESMTDMAAHGQDVRFVKFYLTHYCRHFNTVYLFSYGKEKYRNLPKNCKLITPPFVVHRYIYALLLPFIHKNIIKDCDIFRCFHPSSAIPAVISKVIYGKKFIFNYNYDYTKWAVIEGKEWLVPLIRINQWINFNLANHIFIADEKMYDYAKTLVNEKKLTLIRNAVDVKSFHPTSQRKSVNTKTLISIGRLERQKNYQQLIDAVALLKNRQLNLLIIGKGSLHDELVKVAASKKVNLNIIDVIPHNQLPKLLRNATIYAQPSLIEAPVKTLLEAMSCGLPCIATNVPGINDVIQSGKNGILVSLKASELAKAIKLLLSNAQLAKKLGKAASETIKTKYNLQHFLTLETALLKEQ